jgi:hypothetical protein
LTRARPAPPSTKPCAYTTPPDTGDQTIDNTTITISKSRGVPFRWTGEEQRGVNNGPGYMSLKQQQIAQALRTLTNEVEADLAALYTKASRAHGTSGTAPFGSSPALGDAGDVLRILKDNGAPQGDNHLVINTAAGVNLLKLTQLTKANEAGSDEFLRQGIILPIFGLNIRESAQVKAHTKGTGASATTDNAGYAVGARTITLASAGTGTIVAGDVITFAGDSNQYVVETGDADVSNGGTIVLAKPGLRAAIAASTTAITVTNSYAANLAFARSAIVLAARPPAIPEEGDMADDAMIVTDPRSGLSFELRMYREYRRVRYELALAWGVALIKPEHAALLKG